MHLVYGDNRVIQKARIKINRNMEAKENTDIHPLPQKSPDITDEEELVMMALKEENGEIIDKIPQMEAICEICYSLLQEDIMVLKTKCRCGLSLIHDKCSHENPEKKKKAICNLCEQEIQYVPATLSRASGESLEAQSSPKRSSRFSRLKLFGKDGKTSG